LCGVHVAVGHDVRLARRYAYLSQNLCDDFKLITICIGNLSCSEYAILPLRKSRPFLRLTVLRKSKGTPFLMYICSTWLIKMHAVPVLSNVESGSFCSQRVRFSWQNGLASFCGILRSQSVSLNALTPVAFYLLFCFFPPRALLV
jgi:hypothetical protein